MTIILFLMQTLMIMAPVTTYFTYGIKESFLLTLYMFLCIAYMALARVVYDSDL